MKVGMLDKVTNYSYSTASRTIACGATKKRSA